MCVLKRMKFHCGHEKEWVQLCYQRRNISQPHPGTEDQSVSCQEVQHCCSWECIRDEINSQESTNAVPLADRLVNSTNPNSGIHSECPERSKYYTALRFDDEHVDRQPYGYWVGLHTQSWRLRVTDIISKS